MPYINQEQRKKFDKLVDHLVMELMHTDSGEKRAEPIAGQINYVISRLIWKIFDEHSSYARANELMGVLQGVQAEFYRRKVGPYEDGAIERNGDI